MAAAETLAAVAGALSDHFGHRPARASVSFVGVEPIEVLRFEPIPGERAYVSLGMSRAPMTGSDVTVVDPHGPRAELMLHLRDEIDRFADVWRRVAVLAAAPAVEGVVYRDGMTVDLGVPLVDGSACTGVVVGASAVMPIPVPDTDGAGGADGDRPAVGILQVTPATSTELAWCRVRGAEALRSRWTEHGTDLLDLERRAVPLD